jgi:hypothetical protein
MVMLLLDACSQFCAQLSKAVIVIQEVGFTRYFAYVECLVLEVYPPEAAFVMTPLLDHELDH